MSRDARHSATAARHRIRAGARHRAHPETDAVAVVSGGSRRRPLLAAGAAATAVALLIGASSASAYWTGGGASTAGAATGTTAALAISATVGAADLRPGGTASLRATASNPNGTAVRIRALELDVTRGGGTGFAVDADHAACGASAFTFRNQVVDQTVPARSGGVDGTLALTLADAVGMRKYAASACQGATVTVYLREVAALRSYETQIAATPSPAYRWRMDDADGSATMAAAVGGVTGSYSGSIAAVAGIDGSSPSGGVRFPGQSYGELPGITLDAFSLEFWFATTNGAGTTGSWYNAAALVDADAAGAALDWGVGLRADGSVIAGTGKPDVNVVSGPGYNDGEWHQVVVTRTTGGILTLFVDGTQVATRSDGATGPLSAVTRIRIATGTTSASKLVGRFDEISITTSVLTPTQIRERYHAGFRGIA